MKSLYPMLSRCRARCAGCGPTGAWRCLLGVSTVRSGPVGRSFQWPAGGYSSSKEVFVMPKGKKPGPSVKKPKTYEALKDKGMSKERAAKISNAQAGKQKKSAKRKKNG
jgi:hypothetical protein